MHQEEISCHLRRPKPINTRRDQARTAPLAVDSFLSSQTYGFQPQKTTEKN